MAGHRVLTVCALLCCFHQLSLAAKSDKTESPKPTTTTTTQKPPEPTPEPFILAEMELQDYLRPGALFVAFVATAFFRGDVDTWMKADAIGSAAFGMALYFFPKPLLNYQTEGSIDVVHVYQAQTVGSSLIAFAVMSHACRLSKNPAVRSAHLLSRTLGGMVILLTMVLDYFKAYPDSQRWSINYLTFAALGVALMSLGSFINLFRVGEFGGGSINLRERLSYHVIADLLVCFVFSLINFAYPELTLSNVLGVKVDGIHGHLSRFIGAQIFMGNVFGLTALSFSDDRDRKIMLLGRMTAVLINMPLFCLNQWKYGFLTADHAVVNGIIFSLMGLNAALGYFDHVQFRLPKLKRN